MAFATNLRKIRCQNPLKLRHEVLKLRQKVTVLSTCLRHGVLKLRHFWHFLQQACAKTSLFGLQLFT